MSVFRALVFWMGSLVCGGAACFGSIENSLTRSTLFLAALGIAAAPVFSRFSPTWRLSDQQRRSLGDMGIILAIFFPSLAVLIGILLVALIRS